MLIDLSSLNDESDGSVDTIVVGAGAVGLSLAVDLARRGRRTLVLEAGPLTPSRSSQAHFETATTSGRPLDGLSLGRFRALGGTTNFWGGQLVRFDPLVFAERDWVAEASWPITREDLEPFYDRADALLRPGILPQDDDAIWQMVKLEPPPSSDAVVPFLSRWCPEPNFARLFGNEIARSNLLKVAVNAPVNALIGQGGNISAVRLADGRIMRAPRIVLANGTIEISRLLQLPYMDGMVPPWHRSPWLGRGFMDHLDSYAGTIIPIDKARFHAAFDNVFLQGRKYSPKLKLQEGRQRNEKLLGIAAHFIFRSSLDEHIANLKIMIRGLSRGRLRESFAALPGSIGAMRFVLPMALRYFRHHRMYNLADRGITLRLTSEQRPNHESRISLRQQKDSAGLPLVDVHWVADDSTLRTMARFGVLVADYLEQQGLARVELEPGLLSQSPEFLAAADDANHQMGTARMSSDLTGGVVDRNLRVHGTHNLYVAGAAVYPTTGFANPTFTAIALGLRLAEHLANA